MPPPGIVVLETHMEVAQLRGLAEVMRLGGAEIGVALMGTWLRVREQVHSFYLGQNLVVGDADVVQRLKQLSDYFAAHGTGSAQPRAVGTLPCAR